MCPQGQYGPSCHLTCTCQNGGICDHVDGNCTCGLGWTGRSCEKGDFLLRWQWICTLKLGFAVSPDTHRQGQTVSGLLLVRASGVFSKTVSSRVLLMNSLAHSLFLLRSIVSSPVQLLRSFVHRNVGFFFFLVILRAAEAYVFLLTGYVLLFHLSLDWS